jgi:ectoine hydroxylase-related dioxygenase (phytanoyl-CoA dioxygenase family)
MRSRGNHPFSTVHRVELTAGDAVLLDGLAPHYSEANRSHRRRRVLVASYAPARESYSRNRYYSARADTIAAGVAGGRAVPHQHAGRFRGRRGGRRRRPADRCAHEAVPDLTAVL